MKIEKNESKEFLSKFIIINCEIFNINLLKKVTKTKDSIFIYIDDFVYGIHNENIWLLLHNLNDFLMRYDQEYTCFDVDNELEGIISHFKSQQMQG